MNTANVSAPDEVPGIVLCEQTLIEFATQNNLPAQSGKDLFACALLNQRHQVGSEEVTVGSLETPFLLTLFLPRALPDTLAPEDFGQRKATATQLLEAFLKSRNTALWR
ncbi:MAG TPA: hypothetical protein VHP58_00420 [Alphaproteobacteria bacterium]|nr:hypothetical protein [Alphaproteobacteria bacterium]